MKITGQPHRKACKLKTVRLGTEFTNHKQYILDAIGPILWGISKMIDMGHPGWVQIESRFNWQRVVSNRLSSYKDFNALCLSRAIVNLPQVKQQETTEF